MSREEFSDFKVKAEADRIAVSCQIRLIYVAPTTIVYFIMIELFGKIVNLLKYWYIRIYI